MVVHKVLDFENLSSRLRWKLVEYAWRSEVSKI